MGNNSKNFIRNPVVQGLIIVALLGGIGFGGYAGYNYIQSQLENENFTPTIVGLNNTSGLDDDEVKFLVYLHGASEELDNDEHNIYIYRVNIESMTASDLADLRYTDYSYWTSCDSGDTIDLNFDDYRYYYKLNGSDISTEYGEIVGGMEYILMPYNRTEDVAILAYSTDEFSTSFNQTDYDEWTIRAVPLDGPEGTGEPTSSQGYKIFAPDVDSIFEGLEDYLMIRITTNVSATSPIFCAYTGGDSGVIEVCSGSYIYYQIPRNLWGEQTFTFDLGPGLGSTFEVTRLDFGYGTADSFTSWDYVI